MATWEPFKNRELRQLLNPSGEVFTEVVVFHHNKPYDSGYTHFRVMLRKLVLGNPHEGEQQYKSVSIELTGEEALALAKFVSHFSDTYVERFKKFQKERRNAKLRKFGKRIVLK